MGKPTKLLNNTRILFSCSFLVSQWWNIDPHLQPLLLQFLPFCHSFSKSLPVTVTKTKAHNAYLCLKQKKIGHLFCKLLFMIVSTCWQLSPGSPTKGGNTATARWQSWQSCPPPPSAPQPEKTFPNWCTPLLSNVSSSKLIHFVKKNLISYMQ